MSSPQIRTPTRTPTRRLTRRSGFGSALRRLGLFATALALVTGSAHAQQDEWEYTFAPYLWAAALDGETGVLGRSAGVDASFGDIVDNLEGGGMLYFEAERGRWGMLADVIFTSLGQDSRRPPARVELDQPILELLGSYEVSPSFEVLFGGRYTEIDVDIAFSGPLGLRLDRSQDWLDPMLGGRVTLPLPFGEIQLRGDVGGFGVGSELTWQAMAQVAARVSQRISVALGYRVQDTDYEDGDGPARFEYDVTMTGLQLGLAFHF